MHAPEKTHFRTIAWTVIALVVAAAMSAAQVVPSTATPPTPVTSPASVTQPMPPTPSASAAPASPVPGIRNKLAAGDLLSAESILEVYNKKNGEDGLWLTGLSWLARGAILVDDTAKASRYASQVRKSCAKRIAGGADVAKDHDLEISLGAAIEVEAQLIAKAKGARQAAAYLRGELARVKGPMTLRTRIHKRLNMVALVGEPAPELAVEDHIGTPPPSLASLRGNPVLLFLWYEGCGDCKAQAEDLALVKSRYASRGLQIVALTRYYEDDSLRTAEKARIDSVWSAVYPGVGRVPVVISTASVEEYGGSSTPTFIALDRNGIVRRYTPTRLNIEELERTIEPLLR